ncbi:PREDICTED: cytochrome P450 4c3-like [Ceratosolen solmsi marchali]|uniref:Cytochrome P450 4c3-like n=1 Tax=Ceratosolen solmsi marchali TaxID=326594 RepID=A0AAJ6YTW7_9HYME|nr:PREDICTED: cytochrome P450 4c3-like [Ceratosolen solmsi marchali]
MVYKGASFVQSRAFDGADGARGARGATTPSVLAHLESQMTWEDEALKLDIINMSPRPGLDAVPAAPEGNVSWITCALALNLLLLLGFCLVKRIKFLYKLRHIPSPKALPVFGNAIQLNCSNEAFFGKLLRWNRELGDIYLLWVGSRPFVFLTKVEDVQPLLSSSQHIDKSLEYQYLRPWLGNGLIISAGEKWHARRKLLTPIFHSELLKNYFQVSWKKANILVSCLRTEIGNPEFDIIPYAKRAALDVICESAMGYHINAQTNYRNDYVLAVQSLTAIAQMRFVNIWISYDSIFKRTALGKQQESALKIVHDFVDKVIAVRKLELTAERNANLNEISRKSNTLLDLLLEMSYNGERLSDDDIREEVNTFMFAGHDTVGMTISWILYALGRNPHYQDKILEECDEVLGQNKVTYESLQKLVWLDACIKETWRLYPITPLLARQIYNSITLRGNEIPNGTTVLVNSYLLHRDVRYFPEPNVYRPERFLPDAPKRPSFTFIPFSAGSRNCIGSKFATMEVKMMLLSLLRAYRFCAIDHENQLRFVPKLVLDNVGGIRLSITPRQVSKVGLM